MIYGLLSLLGLGLLLCLLVAPFVALARTGQLRRDVDRLYREMVLLRASFDAAPAAEPPEAPPEHEPAVEPAPAPTPDEPPIDDEPPPAPRAPKEALEQRLTMRWLVWLGGATIALGGVFLVMTVGLGVAARLVPDTGP